jgi:ribonuclease T1
MRRIYLVLVFVTLGLGLFGVSACGGSDNVQVKPPPIIDSQVKSPTLSGAPSASVTRTAVSATRTTVSSTERSPAATKAAPINGMQTIAQSDLPAEAVETLAFIRRGGPFPYRQDGQVFQNREGLLPRKGSGYYHEYTVITPGSKDRGARRIIRGDEGEFYYTDDHYESFKVIMLA